MRIVAGRLGGRTIAAPKGKDVRPTSERVREAIFSMLGDMERFRVLDLFAGSGALGLEALSRGADAVSFVDTSTAAIKVLEANIDELGLGGEEVVGVHATDFRHHLRKAHETGGQYDLVFLDPPYRRAAALGQELSELLPPVLAAGARVVTESDRRAPLDLALDLITERRYGDTLIRIHAAK